MNSIIMKGSPVAKKIYRELKEKIKNFPGRISLSIIQIGENEASDIYIKQKIKACEKLGIIPNLIKFPAVLSIDTKKITETIKKLNEDPTCHGILVQLPIPDHLNAVKIITSIDPHKDVDGLTPANMGQTLIGKEFEYLTPCTALGVIVLLDHYKIEIAGKKVAVIGQGKIAGKPISAMLVNRKATLFSLNSLSKNIKKITRMSDIVITATGKAGLLTSNMIKKGAIVIDVGISRNKDGQITGDADFIRLFKKASFITPVPGGVGKLTVAGLMMNLVKAAYSTSKK